MEFQNLDKTARLPIKKRISNVSDGINPSEVSTIGQTILNTLGVINNINSINVFNGSVAVNKTFAQNHTAVPIATTASGTLSVVTSGVIAGLISSTSVAAVTITLDSVANIITAFAAVGLTIGAGTLITFLVDNSAGANTITVAVDAGATIAVTTPAITGGSTLTVSTANAVAQFGIYITTATTGKLLRMY